MKNLIEKRKEFYKGPTTEIQIDIPDDIYNEALKFCQENEITVEDFIINFLYDTVINNTEKPSGVEEVVDIPKLELYLDEYLNSGKTILILDEDLKPASIMVSHENYEEILERTQQD